MLLLVTSISKRISIELFATIFIFSLCSLYMEADCFLFEPGKGKHKWTYNDQLEWETNFKSCGSKFQSPIDIQSSNVQENPDLKLQFFNYDKQIKFKLQNAHHTIKLSPVLNPASGQENELQAEHKTTGQGGQYRASNSNRYKQGQAHRVSGATSRRTGVDPLASSASSVSSGYESAEEMLFMNKSLPDLMLPVANNNIDNNRDSSNSSSSSSSSNSNNSENINMAPIFSGSATLDALSSSSSSISSSSKPLLYDGRPTVKLSTLDEENNVFHLHDIHLHWGERKDNGSEHAIDGRRGAMELHLVHIRSGLNKSVIEFNSDSLLVIGIIIDSQRKSNAQFDPIVNSLTRINMTDAAELIDYRSLLELLPDQLDRFYWYWGSLTTPPCYEVVNWIVMERRLTMNSKQIEMFRQLYASIEDSKHGNEDEHEMPNLIVPNIRYLQPAYDRPVFGTKGLGRKYLTDQTTVKPSRTTTSKDSLDQYIRVSTNEDSKQHNHDQGMTEAEENKIDSNANSNAISSKIRTTGCFQIDIIVAFVMTGYITLNIVDKMKF